MESSNGSELEMITKKEKNRLRNIVYRLMSESESDDNSMVEECDGNTASSNASEERIERQSTHLSSLGKHTDYLLGGILQSSFIKLTLYWFSGTNVNDKEHPESEVAIKQEIGVDHIDSYTTQKRALLVFKMEQLKDELSRTKVTLTIHLQGNESKMNF